jgi:C_GCAxxG_C_C family probable redox protein
LQEVFGMKNDDIFKAASGFGGGMGMQSDTCGALVGAGMMLSLKYGRGREEIENMEALRESGVPVAKLYKWFQTEFGSATCRNIRTKFGGGAFYDFSVPWQRELAEKAKIFEQCSQLVGKAAAKAAEMLWDADEAEKK